MTTIQEAKERLFREDPGLKAEYDRLGPRFEAIGALIDARMKQDVSQRELARRMNVPANVVSRLESAQHSPRLDTIAEYAKALGYDVKIRLIKKPTNVRAKRTQKTPARGRTATRAARASR